MEYGSKGWATKEYGSKGQAMEVFILSIASLINSNVPIFHSQGYPQKYIVYTSSISLYKTMKNYEKLHLIVIASIGGVVVACCHIEVLELVLCP